MTSFLLWWLNGSSGDNQGAELLQSLQGDGNGLDVELEKVKNQKHKAEIVGGTKGPAEAETTNVQVPTFKQFCDFSPAALIQVIRFICYIERQYLKASRTLKPRIEMTKKCIFYLVLILQYLSVSL